MNKHMKKGKIICSFLLTLCMIVGMLLTPFGTISVNAALTKPVLTPVSEISSPFLVGHSVTLHIKNESSFPDYKWSYSLSGDACKQTALSGSSITLRGVKTGELTITATGTYQNTVSPDQNNTVSATYRLSVAPRITSIKTASKLTIGKGESRQLSLSISPSNHKDTVTYTSDHPQTVSVSKTGMIKGLKSGSAKIRITSSQKNASAVVKVTVKKAPTSIKLNKKTLTLGVKETGKLTYTLSKGSSSAVKYASTKKRIATVSENGTVTALRTGKTEIRVKTFNGKTAKCTVLVKKAPSSVKASVDSKKMNIGDQQTIHTKLSKNSAGSISFTSANPKIAKVSAKGKITALKKGTTTITAKTYNGKKSKVRITVRPNAKQIRLSATSLSLYTGDGYALKIKYKPSNSREEIRWSSSNAGIASVDATGVVTAVAAGTTRITAKTKSGKAKASCTVTVTNPIYVAITFDDGPSASTTPGLLDGLKARGAKATFFMVGTNVARNPDLVQRIYNEGHQMGNHSYAHTKNAGGEEFQQTNNLVIADTGIGTSVYRPPYGSYNANVQASIPVPLVLWSVDTLDWKYRDANYVKTQVVNGATEGAVILLHDIHPTSVAGVLAAIDELQARGGYKFVTISEMMAHQGVAPTAGMIYR